MRREAESNNGIEGLNRNDVPSVAGNNVSGQEIDVGGGIAAFYPAAGGSGDAVAGTSHDGDGFHLYAVEAGTGIHDEIVAGIVAEGPGDGEAESAGGPEKTHFSPLALAFAVMRGVAHWFFWEEIRSSEWWRRLARLARRR